MSRFDAASAVHSQGSSEDAALNHPPMLNERHTRERDSSPSSEDSLSFAVYGQSSKADPDGPEDTQLTAQTLNTDGTPKRPMNAFMIFARRRRPQVSAENQMMRTGEISKILSKEWNSMDMSEKQFYLNQAKRLKENFNAKYPDYVYRRRPNNSRKKRRSDASLSTPLNPSPSADPTDDAAAGFQDFEYPTERDDPSPYPSHRGHAGLPYENAHGPAASYGFPLADLAPSHFGSPHGHIAGLPSMQPRGVDVPSLAPLAPHDTHDPYRTQTHTHLADNHLPRPNTYAPSDSLGEYNFNWSGDRTGTAGTGGGGVRQRPHSTNMYPGLALSGARERSLSGAQHSPPPHRPWSSTTSHTSSSNSSTSPQLSTSGAGAGSGGARYHPLTSSFFPDNSADTYRAPAPASAHDSYRDMGFGGGRAPKYDSAGAGGFLGRGALASPYAHAHEDRRTPPSLLPARCLPPLGAHGMLGTLAPEPPGAPPLSYWDRIKMEGH